MKKILGLITDFCYFSETHNFQAKAMSNNLLSLRNQQQKVQGF